MTYTESGPVGGRAGVGETPARRTYWPLVFTAAGLAGLTATILTDVHVDPDGGVTVTSAMVKDVNVTTARFGFYAGVVTVTLLLVLAAMWRRHVEPRVPGSTAARVVSLGVAASAAGLTYGYGWKGALAIYAQGGKEDDAFDEQGRYVYYMLTDFGGYIGWLGVVVAAGAIAWMALRERTVSRWIGVVSVLLILALLVFWAFEPVPGLPALVAQPWLLITGLGLTFGKSTITR
ncbi:hypothetical protein [Yinghuangia seranimata]|uniref:hypothetical protein n=1 Tax=Yinghuangia seranimata TaxID=408067 RepID=UPI00248B0723|nr:hypothetical protein [Yinghuangia seranimata]MDI2126790.1 hypothetical protein [Yinghuangia seranimata]